MVAGNYPPRFEFNSEPILGDAGCVLYFRVLRRFVGLDPRYEQHRPSWVPKDHLRFFGYNKSRRLVAVPTVDMPEPLDKEWYRIGMTKATIRKFREQLRAFAGSGNYGRFITSETTGDRLPWNQSAWWD